MKSQKQVLTLIKNLKSWCVSAPLNSTERELLSDAINAIEETLHLRPMSVTALEVIDEILHDQRNENTRDIAIRMEQTLKEKGFLK